MKIHETAVKNRLSLVVEPLLSNAQHGFRPGRSVSTNLLNSSIVVHNAFQKSRQADSFHGDFEAAFDNLWHKRLIEKLARFKIGYKTAKWICEFITLRQNFVKIGNAKSRTYRSPSGVPAGSSLGPLLFAIFIDDITEAVIHAIVLLFADDIKLILEIRVVNGMDNSFMLQHDINSLMRWCENNRLFFNRLKCFIFSAYRDNVHFINTTYTMDGHAIERREEIRDLGVLLDRRFSFGHHIEQITIKCRQLIGCIKRHSNGNFTKETQRILYLAYVRSRLEFASVIWNPYLEIYIDDIESIQKQFVIYLLDSRVNASSYRYSDRCKLVKLQELELRRKIADVIFAFDIYTNRINDVQISSKFERIEYVRDFRTNTLSLLAEPYHINEYQIKQPLTRMIRSINDYKSIVAECTSRDVFKNRITEEIMSPSIVIRRY